MLFEALFEVGLNCLAIPRLAPRSQRWHRYVGAHVGVERHVANLPKLLLISPWILHSSIPFLIHLVYRSRPARSGFLAAFSELQLELHSAVPGISDRVFYSCFSSFSICRQINFHRSEWNSFADLCLRSCINLERAFWTIEQLIGLSFGKLFGNICRASRKRKRRKSWRKLARKVSKFPRLATRSSVRLLCPGLT